MWRELAHELAMERMGAHGANEGRNFYPDGTGLTAHELGAVGEIYMGRLLDLPVCRSGEDGRDPGWDFEVFIRGRAFRIDTKTSDHRKPRLLVPVDDILRKGEVSAYALVRFYEERPVFMGWETREVLLYTEPREFGHEVLNYWRDECDLRPLQQLRRIVEMRDAPAV